MHWQGKIPQKILMLAILCKEHIENGKLSTQLISTTKKKLPQIFIIKIIVK